jgi:hypothetical protein
VASGDAHHLTRRVFDVGASWQQSRSGGFGRWGHSIAPGLPAAGATPQADHDWAFGPEPPIDLDASSSGSGESAGVCHPSRGRWAAVLISGIEVPLAVVAMPALRLDRRGDLELSSRLGFAVDLDRAEFRIRPRDRERLLQALEDNGPDDLDELRAALRRGFEFEGHAYTRDKKSTLPSL